MEKPNKALSGHATRGGWLRAALLSGLALGLMLGCGGGEQQAGGADHNPGDPDVRQLPFRNPG